MPCFCIQCYLVHTKYNKVRQLLVSVTHNNIYLFYYDNKFRPPDHHQVTSTKLRKKVQCGANGILFIILIHVPCIFDYFVLRPTNAQLFHKLSHSYTFRYYRVILSQLVINTLPSYTGISNAAFGNTIHNYDVSRRFYASSHTIVVEISV